MSALEPKWLHDDATRTLLSEQLRAASTVLLQEVQASPVPPRLQPLVLQVLQAPGKLLSRPIIQGALIERRDIHSWAVLTLLTTLSSAQVHQERAPEAQTPAFWQRISAVVTAVELLTTAIDLVDDMQDGDSDMVQAMGLPQALGISVVLQELAALALHHARRAGWQDKLADAALEALHTAFIGVMAGQALDIQLESVDVHTISEAQILAITDQKSGTLMALVTRLGALAGANALLTLGTDYVEAMSQFGRYLGVWMQLVNDLHDARLAEESTGKSDRRRGKKTLPLFFEATLPSLAPHAMIESTMAVEERTRIALAYTYTAAHIFRLRTQTALEDLERHFGPHPLLWPLVQEEDELSG